MEYGDTEIPRLDPNAFAVEDLITDTDLTGIDWQKLAGAIDTEGYSLHVTKNGDDIFTNDVHLPPNIMSFMENVNWDEDGKTFYASGATIIGKKTNGYTVIAVNGGDKNEISEMQKNQFEVALKVFLVIGLLAIAVILIVSQFFTSWLLKRIMRRSML